MPVLPTAYTKWLETGVPDGGDDREEIAELAEALCHMAIARGKARMRNDIGTIARIDAYAQTLTGGRRIPAKTWQDLQGEAAIDELFPHQL